MAKKARNDMSDSKFANAKARASEKVAKGKLSPRQAVKLNHQADAVLGKHDAQYHNCGKC